MITNNLSQSPEATLLYMLIDTETDDSLLIWKAILLQALIDLKSKPGSSYSDNEREEVESFFKDSNSTLDEICFMADVPACRYRRYGLDLIKQNNKPVLSIVTSEPQDHYEQAL